MTTLLKAHFQHRLCGQRLLDLSSSALTLRVLQFFNLKVSSDLFTMYKSKIKLITPLGNCNGLQIVLLLLLIPFYYSFYTLDREHFFKKCKIHYIIYIFKNTYYLSNLLRTKFKLLPLFMKWCLL